MKNIAKTVFVKKINISLSFCISVFYLFVFAFFSIKLGGIVMILKLF